MKFFQPNNIIAYYLLFVGLFVNKTSSFMQYYKNLTIDAKENLHTLGYKYPDEFFVLNMLTDR